MIPWIATRLRYLADHIDPAGAPRRMSYNFTFERGTGIVFNDCNQGCPLWYLGTDSYERAHDESTRPA